MAVGVQPTGVEPAESCHGPKIVTENELEG
jgi:hypothetical protein